jgi:hypothetical protein
MSCCHLNPLSGQTLCWHWLVFPVPPLPDGKGSAEAGFGLMEMFAQERSDFLQVQ